MADIVVDTRCYRTLDENGAERIVVTWNNKVPNNPTILGFNIYRADADTFKIIKRNCTQNFYLDLAADVFPGKEYYYKVTFVNPLSVESSLLDASKVGLYTDTPPGLAAQHLYYPIIETIRRCNWGFQQIGESVKILLRRRVGLKCPKCFDPLRTSGTDPRCTECWGTGIVGGWDIYLGRSIIYEMPPEAIPQTPFGLQVTYIPKGWMGNYPVLHEGDMILRQDDRGYMITNVSPYYMQNYLIQQQYSMSFLDYGHIIYKIKL